LNIDLAEYSAGHIRKRISRKCLHSQMANGVKASREDERDDLCERGFPNSTFAVKNCVSSPLADGVDDLRHLFLTAIQYVPQTT
jgi:hypothetical protein